MSGTLALPSPPHGVEAVRVRTSLAIRRFLVRHIAAEPSDLPARVTIGTVVCTKLSLLVNTLLGMPFLMQHPALLWLSMRVLWPLSLILLTTGLLSQSRSARFISTVMTSAVLVGLIALGNLGLPTAVAATVIQLAQAASTAALGVWLARSIRRRVLGTTDSGD